MFSRFKKPSQYGLYLYSVISVFLPRVKQASKLETSPITSWGTPLSDVINHLVPYVLMYLV